MADLSYYLERVLGTLPKKEDRPFLNFAVEKVGKSGIIVVEAPTGYGKSVISQTVALSALEEGLKCIIAFPLRSLLEDQVSKFRSMLSKLGHDEGNVGVRYMHHPESKYLLRPISLTTVDTFSLTLFGIAPEDLEVALGYYDGTLTRSMGHYLFSRSMALLSDVILDEVHLVSDMTKSLSFLIALIWIAAGHGMRLILMSATIPKALEELLRREGENIGLEFAKFSENPDNRFLEERRAKKYDFSLEKLDNGKFEKILEWLKEGRKEGFRRSIVVFNTVSEAVKFYEIARERLDVEKSRMLLIHSRFTEEDKEEKRRRIEELKKLDEYLIVATQVIEAGVDISSDLFISDLAPASSLIQRLGRFLRYDEKEGKIYLWYEDEKREKYKGVYYLDLLEKTLEFLEEKSVKFHDPESYQPLLNSVYDESSFSLRGSDIREFISIQSTLKNPDMAVEKFIECEGSFVRESSLVPVIPSFSWNENMTTKDIEKHLVPMSLSTVSRIRPREILVVREEDPEKVSKIAVDEKFWQKKVLKKVVSPKFVAFLVDGSYDQEKGLVMRHGESS